MDSYETFVQDHTRALLGTAHLLTGGRREEAEDLTQETLLRAYAKWGHVEASQYPGAYVRKIMVNLYTSQIRRKRIPLAGPQHLDTFPEPSDPTRQVDDQDALSRALEQLAPRERVAVVLKHYHHMNTAEIADAMSVTESSARSALSRGLAALRARLITT